MSHKPISSRREVILPSVEVDFDEWDGDPNAWNPPPQRARSVAQALPPVEVDFEE